ncbi:hypothetical protein PF008_g20324 [Phytophthora fragariae]|uniref:Prolyl 4-hydroxylase alpha subunit Fe(2+) 2OG dioxygenase domain-containing protein n=1 Tax=Phytophthora fragariae TaxID=53985 RepID=A0A6G0R036_9STRA|nr:hypothetical protein PF008_g20324 [Phytophthora fragariae]
MARGCLGGYELEEGDADYDVREPTEAQVFNRGRWPFGVTGKATDVPMPKDELCVELSDVLSRADDQAGEFSFGGQADTLPADPQLVVEEVGAVTLPLVNKRADVLIAQCKKSPFGKKLDTFMDEKFRKSWQLAPDQVTFKNPQWETGMDQLRESIATRLGCMGVPMQCKLYKLLVYGKGGHFVKHQDTEKEDGMVATLVVQLPSKHEGGDLVVYRGGKEVQRHDFGKREGTAASLPHFAVHYADADHKLEKVTKGYRLVAVYSLCLPSNMRDFRRNLDKSMSDELAGWIGRLKPVDEAVSLLLSHEYTMQSVTDLGTRALKSIDRARVDALEEANATLPAGKRLHFYIAELTHDVGYDDVGGSWEECERHESIKWYSTRGESYGSEADSTVRFNFLNPGRNTLAELWEGHGNSTYEGYLGNEHATRSTIYSRYDVVAWPAACCVETASKFISASAALNPLQTQESIDAEALRKFMTTAATSSLDGENSQSRTWFRCDSPSRAVRFCRVLCELILNAGDATLAEMFFSNFFHRLWVGVKEAVLPSVTSIAEKFGWDNVRQALLGSLSKDDTAGVDIALKLSKCIGGEAEEELVNAAIELAVKVSDESLCWSNVVGPLWEAAFNSGDKAKTDALCSKFKQMDPSLLPRVIATFSQHFGDIDASGDKFAVLSSIVAVRVNWLNNQLQTLVKPFNWEMPQALFLNNAQIQAYLRGPSESMNTTGVLRFTGLPNARRYIRDTHHFESTASYTMEVGGREEEADYDKTEPTEAEIFKGGTWPFGVKGKATDIPLPKDTVCAQISNVLARAEDQAGEFSFGGQGDTLPVAPGLVVKGVGTIALPLCKTQADELIAKCNKSPFGKKLDTMLDEKVRKSWQLAPDQVAFKNPQWETGMDQLRETIATRLGYKGVPMQCKLYKLLVYGKGGHFVKHQDTEKEDGMVATLVVQLPSEHEGGDLVV